MDWELCVPDCSEQLGEQFRQAIPVYVELVTALVVDSVRSAEKEVICDSFGMRAKL